jgi:predicted nucleotidyltransferase
VDDVIRQSAWRALLGRRVGLAYAQHDSVAAVLLAGSSARGHADRYSDVELLVAWDDAPTAEDRAAIVSSLADDHRLIDFDEPWQCWEDELFVGRDASGRPNSGVPVEVVHQLVPVIEGRIADVVERFDPDLDKQSTIHAITRGVRVHGEPMIGTWAARAEPYPRELAAAMVRRYGQIDRYADWQMHMARGPNLMLAHERLAQVERHVLLMLQALNGRYHYKFKWLIPVIEELAIAPPELAARLAEVHLDVADGAGSLSQLVEETYDLVEAHLPEIDVERLRAVFRWQRPEWDELPS